MHPTPRHKLIDLVARYGKELADDPRRCEALLRDMCGGDNFKREVGALTTAAKERIASELAAGGGGVPYEVIQQRAVKRLHNEVGMIDELARWSVESWALALGVVAPDDLEFLFVCPSCGVKKQAAAQLAGKQVRCPKCRVEVAIGRDRSVAAILKETILPVKEVRAEEEESPVLVNEPSTKWDKETKVGCFVCIPILVVLGVAVYFWRDIWGLVKSAGREETPIFLVAVVVLALAVVGALVAYYRQKK